VVRAQNLRTARPVNKNYRLLNILRNADVNKVRSATSALAELLLRWRFLRRNFTFGFGFGEVTVLRMSVSISKPNFLVIDQSAAEI